MAKVGIGEFGGCGLGGAKFDEGYEELVLDCANIIEGVANDGLNSFEAGIFKFGAGVERFGELLLGTIVDWGVSKRSVLGFVWEGMAHLRRRFLM